MAYNTADELCWAYVGTSSDACGTAPTGATTYSYDNNGNQTSSSAGLTLAYNPANQAVSMTNPTGANTTAMTYAGVGNAQRVTAGTTTYNNNTFGVASATTSGSTTYFTYDPDGRPNSLVAGGSRYYDLYDGLGNIIGLINTSGTQQAAYTYDPYGNITSSSGTEASANPLQYETGYADVTGYAHFGARYQNPTLGAWTQLDPSGQSPGYNYAGSNPINSLDPTGLSPSLSDLANSCAKGAVTSVGIGAIDGTDETGVGVLGDAAAGCGYDVIGDFANEYLGSTVGTVFDDLGIAGDASDALKNVATDLADAL